MTARTGMIWLIDEIRVMCDLGTADYTVKGSAYWTDDQIQQQLDKCRTDYHRAMLNYVTDYDAGTVRYLDYYANLSNLEDATSGSAVWQIEDSEGNAVGTADYTANYQNGHIRFGTDRGGTAYYMRARSYNLDRAASTIWKMKAAHYALAYDFAADNQRFSRSQMISAALEMAREYDKRGGVMSVRMVRGDLL